MPRNRFALCAVTALSFIAVGFAGCNHSTSSDEKSAAVHDDSGGDDDKSVADTEKAAKPQHAPGPYYPTVVLKTTLGDLTIELDPQTAPRTVNNFLNYVESGFYNQTIFHQVDAGYIALGGTYTPELVEREGRYPIANEADNGRKNVRGTIAMARQIDAIDSSTCQFFINLNDNPHLDHRGDSPEDFGFCVFGKITEGMEVLQKLSAVEVEDKDDFTKLPVETVLIESAYRLR